MPRSPLRVGVIGVGHLGVRHAQTYASLPGVRLTAVCDIDLAKARRLARQLHCEAVIDARQLIGRIDAASVAVPTTLHYAVGTPLLSAGIHLLIEKPLTTSLRQAQALIDVAARRRCVLQVGHIERFNAAIHAAMGYVTHPRFIEVHRLSPYPFRGTDVSVILDVMIHDLDLLLAFVRAPVRRIQAIGISVLSSSEDIANARIEFASGCIANLTASRISDETIRRIRVFQHDNYLSIDYQAQTVELACLRRGRGRQARKSARRIQRVHLPVNRRPPLQEELASFIRAITDKRAPDVSGEDGKAALALALRIEQMMRRDPPRAWHGTGP